MVVIDGPNVPTQQLITPELASRIAAYDAQLSRWRTGTQARSRGWLLCAGLAAPLWLISFAAAAFTGTLNQGTWLVAFSFFTFVAALGASLAAVGLALSVVLAEAPTPDGSIAEFRK